MTLAAEGLACRRGERLLFAGLDFTLAPGEALFLRGPNGVGKSSLLRIAALLLRPAEGRFLWEGADVAEDPDAHRARLAYVGHLDAVKPVLTVAENVTAWSRLRGGTADPMPALERLGIPHLAELPARLLSAGQRKRTALARLLAAPARLWLLDEPTVSLDDDGVRRLGEAVDGHLGGGGMALIATHVDLPLARARTLALRPPAFA